jgi:16S rRNA (uracil1498-N3)-methyltransferase
VSTHRFYIAPEEWDPGVLALRGAEAHHARNVLRMKRGDKAVLFNGRGREITAEVVDLSTGRVRPDGGFARDQIRLRKLDEAETPRLRCRITLGQAIPKGKNMDLIVQKAVELGAAEIAPLISERTIVDLDPREAEQKRAKWRQVAIEAAKQCGQNWLPEIDSPRKLKDFFGRFPSGVASGSPRHESVRQEATVHGDVTAFDLRLIGSLQPDAQHLKRILADYQSAHGRQPGSVLVLIGPEGDFTPAELALAKSQWCLPITLGPIILRVETAAIYCLSVLAYELL